MSGPDEKPAVWDTMVYVPLGTPENPRYCFNFNSKGHLPIPEREMGAWDFEQIRNLTEYYLLDYPMEDIEDIVEQNCMARRKIARAIAERMYSKVRSPYSVVPINNIGVVRVQGTRKNPVYFLDLDHGKSMDDDDVKAVKREIDIIMREYKNEA